MKDQYKREIDYMRISVTDQCNLRCYYCMPKKGVIPPNNSDLLTDEELLQIAFILPSIGINKIKITGGEPLIRKNIIQLISMMKQITGINTVTLTTNGQLLKQYTKQLLQSGISSINISIDTMQKEIYKQITRGGDLQAVFDGIDAIREYGTCNIKLNCVPIMTEEKEIIMLSDYAFSNHLLLRFIEMMPIGYGKNIISFTEQSIKQLLEKTYGCLLPVSLSFGNGPAHYYNIKGTQHYIGFISAISHKFCQQCNRVRLTANGSLKTCLQYEKQLDIKTLLRSGCSKEQLKEKIQQTIFQKPLEHHFLEEMNTIYESGTMNTIGG